MVQEILRMAAEFAHENEFNKLLAGRADVDLVWLMLEFSSDAYPDVDWLSCLAEIDRLGNVARSRVAEHAPDDTRGRLAAISRLLYQEEGFRGNCKAYYDPRNSYLNEVLSRRCGIPISLGIVYLAVARRAGLPVYGVATPGHFVLGCNAPGEPLYVDPFCAGDILDRAACQARVEECLCQKGVLTDQHFRAASMREIAVRVLRNLKAAYALEDQWEQMLPVQKRLSLLLPDYPEERRDLGLIYLRTGRAPRAVKLLEQFAQGCSKDQAREVEPFLRSARRMMAELN